MDIVADTPRLIIAKIEKSDTDSLFQLTGDQRVMEYFPKVLNYSETNKMVDEILSQYEKHGYCYWKLLRNNRFDFIGIAGLLHQEIDGNVETEISYRIRPRYWNRGFASEAAQACKEYAEKVLHKSKLISIIHPKNTASKRIATKLGAKQSGTTLFLGMEHELFIY